MGLSVGTPLPEDTRDALVSLYSRLGSLEVDLITLRNSLTRVLFVEPARPRDGHFARADGTSWNPGAGAGLYQYQEAAWVKL